MTIQLRSWIPWVFFLSFFPLGAIFPYLVEDLQDKQIQDLALILALPSLMSLFVAPLWGMLADWLGNWSLILKTAVLIAVFGLYLLVQWDSSWVEIGMFFYAVGVAPIAPITDALALESVSKEPERYGALRLWGSVGYMAGVLTVPIVQYFIEISALSIGLSSMILFAVLAWNLPEPTRVQQSNLRKGLHLLAKNKILIWIMICAATHFSMHLANANYLVLHLQQLGFSNQWVSASMTAGIAVEIAVMAYSKRLLERYSAPRVFQFAASIAILRWIAMALASSGVLIVLIQATHGLSFGLFWIAAIALVKEHTPSEAVATGQSLLSAAVGGVGATIGVYGASVIVASTSTQMMYWVAAGVAILATMMTSRIR